MINFLKKHKKTFTYHIPLLLLSIFLTSIVVYLLFLKNKTSPNQTVSQYCQDCNVILISVDTLRYDRLGINGYTKKTSPNIDKFFKDGVIFENAYAQAPWTLPSHSAMLTGIYPHKLNVEVSPDIVPPEAETIAETLRQNGYNTAAFSTGGFVSPDQGFSQGFEYFKHNKDWQDAKIIKKEIAQWLSQNRKSKFFLFIHTFHIHDPYSPQKKYIRKIDPDYKGKLDSVDISLTVKLNSGKLSLPQEDLNRIATLYDGEITELDDNLGVIFRKLEGLGLVKNTIIILTSDHGEEFGERGVWGMHGYSLYNELLHVPLLVRTPSNLSTKRVSASAGLVDIYPTILKLLNMEIKTATDGISLIDVYPNNANDQRTIYAESAIEKNQMLANIEQAYQGTFDGTFRPIPRHSSGQFPKVKAVIWGKYKLIQNFDGSFELYDLQNDPKEKENLTNSLQDIKEKLEVQLNQFASSSKQ